MVKTLIENMRDHLNLFDDDYKYVDLEEVASRKEMNRNASTALSQIMSNQNMWYEVPKSSASPAKISQYWQDKLAPLFDPYFKKYGYSKDAYYALAEVMEDENLHAFTRVSHGRDGGYVLGSD